MHKTQSRVISFENQTLPNSIELARRQKLAEVIGERDKAVIDLQEVKEQRNAYEFYALILTVIAVALSIALAAVVAYAKFD